MSISDIKSAIKTNLDALVTDTTLGAATTTDIKKDPLNADITDFPHAFIMPPAIESEVLDNRSVLRTYTFDIMVVIQAEDITGTAEIETLMETVMNKFDNDPTLQGTARGGVLPVTSAPAPFQHNGKDLIMFIIQLQAKADVALTFS